ncbi:MAG: GGDEF domain-containing protein [Treponema sp.]|nr:GGDEF domain-containing protein [Treponema sp.]
MIGIEEKKYRIGFIINDASSDYSKGLVKGMQQACYENNCSLFIFPVGEFGMSYSPYGYQKRAVASMITKYNLDGLVFSSAVHGSHVSFEKLKEYIQTFSDIPVISLNSIIPGLPSIMADCEPGIINMVSHLITKHGCKRIALMTAGENSKEAEERTNAYKKALSKHGIPFDESLILYGFFSYQMAYKALEDYRAEHHFLDFDALVCLNDYMAYGAIDYCKQNHISIPNDICITGFDDIPKTSVSDPTLSSINQQIEIQGKLAVDSLLKMIKGEPVKDITKVPTKVRYRQSCGCIDLKESYFDYETEQYTVISKESTLRNNSSSEWLVRKDQLVEINNYFSNSQGQINLYDFTGNFQFTMTNFSVSAAAVCIYEDPIYEPKIFDHFEFPERTFVLAAYDNTRNFSYKRDENTQPFNPQEMIVPKEYMEFSSDTYFVVALSNCEYQYGYMVFKAGAYDEVMYDLICTILSHQLASAYKLTKDQEERAKLDASNRHLRQISRTDELTKLLNRRGLLELGQEAIDLALKREKTGLVIFGDMDNLKRINDTFGHDSGDKAIIATANILQKVFRTNDIIARIGGDEFAIVAPGLDNYSFTRIKEKIEKECIEWNSQNENDFKLSISLGFTTFNAENFAMSALLLEADAKQYKEKRLKKSKESDKART